MSKPVLFVTGLGKDKARAENLMALYQAYPGEKVYISGHDPDANNIIRSGKYDLMVIDVFPIVKPKKAIMIWHAIQGGKYIGLDQKGTYYKPDMAQLIDYIIAAGSGGVEMFHRCTGVDYEKILPMGMPRTDRYLQARGLIPENYNYERPERVYLYAPTFRSANDLPMPEIDWHAIDQQLTDDEVMIVKAHPYGKEFNIMGCGHILNTYKMEPSYNYLLMADVVITDYSSIMFDAYLLDKPVVLFEKETGYVQKRGMYLNYPDEYCSRYTMDETEMVQLARDAYCLTEVEQDCLNYVADRCDGSSCARICQFIGEVNNGL